MLFTIPIKRHKEQKQECGATRNEDHAKRHEEGRRSRLEARGREEPAQPVMQRDALEDENSTKQNTRDNKRSTIHQVFVPKKLRKKLRNSPKQKIPEARKRKKSEPAKHVMQRYALEDDIVMKQNTRNNGRSTISTRNKQLTKTKINCDIEEPAKPVMQRDALKEEVSIKQYTRDDRLAILPTQI